MGLGYILNKVAAEMGYNLNDSSDRAYLVDKTNEAARAIYRRQDIPISLKECFVRVTPDNEMSLPPFIGEPRAIRPGCKDYCFTHWVLHSMWGKYTKQQWAIQWKNWRVKGTSCLAIDIINTAPGTIEIATADPTLVITLVGENDDSNNVVESITMDATSKTWTKQFVTFKRIYKNKVSDFNIIIKDIAGNEISMIYADQIEARYSIIDVSEYPKNLCGDCTCPDGSFIMEVLYKPILPVMSLDSDSFPVADYDDVIVIKTKQLITELQEGKEDRAILMENKAKQELKDINQDKSGTVEKRLNFKRNPTFRNSGYYR